MTTKLGPETMDQSEVAVAATPDRQSRVPGVVLVFTGGRPKAVGVPLVNGAIELGRDHEVFAGQPDPRVSRRHLRVHFDGRCFHCTDLGSRNGTAADGEPLQAGVTREVARVVRIGDSLFVLSRDIGPLQRHGVRVEGRRVEGPALQEALLVAARAGRLGRTLHISGESGSGKEGVARAFHAAASGPSGPFEAVNCATIPEGVAERLLFGTKRGAYSGADADADGYVQAAHGGTLFLDEVAELSLPVQAKLLRVLETGEVVPLGASRPRKVELRLCSATHRDLRGQVAAGKLREDLYFRIATPRVVVPPLRDRPEEVAWLLQEAVQDTAASCRVHGSLVETCLLRSWPGNVRELLAEARSATQAADGAGDSRVEGRHLSSSAGTAFAAAEAPAATVTPRLPPRGSTEPPTRDQLIDLLRRHQGNISGAARELAVHRTQLRRWLVRYGLVGPAAGSPEAEPRDDGDADEA